MKNVEFPVGYHRLHRTKIIDYQLNRWYSLGYVRLDDISEAAGRLRGLADWTPEMLRQAEKAMNEKRFMNAAFYYRAAEFFVLPDHPDKRALYEAFIELFYEHVASEDLERAKVPYQDAYLPALRLAAGQNTPRGTLVIHGGFDSFIEELYSWACYFAKKGYEVIMFDGPGQGGALFHHGLPLIHEWEKPAAAVLDHFERDQVTWLGVSMGGWLCFRAAAFEPRISRVIASSVVFDYLQIPPGPIQAFARFVLRFPRVMNAMARMKMKLRAQERWGMHNMMHIFKQDTPMAAAAKMLELSEQNLHAERVTQDVLILSGAEDHFIPLKMHKKQVAALTQARSITERIFTRKEQAENHCQIGNVGLALDTMSDWLAGLESAQGAPS